MKVGYIIAGTATLALLGYVGFVYFWDPATKTLKLKKSDEVKTPDPAIAASTTTAPKTTIIKQPVITPKGTGTTVTEPVRTTPGFGTPNTVVRQIGDKAFAGAKGANAYTSAAATSANLYKNYKTGAYIGTYLGIEGSFTKLIVEETGFLSNTFKTVYVLTANLKY